MKDVFAGLAIGLTLIGFAPYVWGIAKGTVQPHVFSWVIWGSTTFAVFVAQVVGGAGVGAWPIGVSGVITLGIALWAYLKRADTQITRQDWVFLILALSALPIWLWTQNPLWAVLILTWVDVLGFGPTWRKVYRQPHSESAGFYALFATRNFVVLLALEHYSATTVLFPLVIGLVCVALIGMMLVRRVQLRGG